MDGTQLSNASGSELGSLNWYSVKRGETLATVARKHGVNRSDLAEANNLKVSSRIRSGQNLIIPREPATLLAARTDRPAPAAVASRSISAPAVVASSAPAVVTSSAPQVAASVEREPTSRPVTYKVKRGDTLLSIAKLFDTTVARLKSLNRLRGSRIAVGDRLTVRAR